MPKDTMRFIRHDRTIHCAYYYAISRIRYGIVRVNYLKERHIYTYIAILTLQPVPNRRPSGLGLSKGCRNLLHLQ